MAATKPIAEPLATSETAVLSAAAALTDGGPAALKRLYNAYRLARAADVHLNVSVPQEACPHNLTPTASTTAALVMGDALAVALLEARGFSPEDFARSHPGGSLGKRLLTRVDDIMRRANDMPIRSFT